MQPQEQGRDSLLRLYLLIRKGHENDVTYVTATRGRGRERDWGSGEYEGFFSALPGTGSETQKGLDRQTKERES